jgi:hypothetical protein
VLVLSVAAAYTVSLTGAVVGLPFAGVSHCAPSR